MYCNNCGYKNIEDAKFCQKCGSAVGKHAFTPKEDSYRKTGEDSTSSSNRVENYKSYLATLIRAKSIRRLYFGCVLIITSILIFLSQFNYIANLISGPRPLDSVTLESEILSGNVKDINVSIQLTPDAVFKSGYTDITKTTNETTNKVESTTTNSEYYLTIIGKHILVLEGLPNVLPSNTFKGVVIPLDEELKTKLIADFNNEPELADLSTSILSYKLSNKGITGIDQFWVFLLGLGLFIWGAIVVFRRISDLDDKNHYIYKATPLAGYNSLNELSDDFVKTRQQSLIKDHKNFVQMGGYYLNYKFLFKDEYFSFYVFPLSQMYWAYKRIIRKSVNFIPTGKDFEVVMHFKPNKIVAVNENEESVNQHLMLLITLCPNAKFGYTK